jgi:hypothetical protein
MPMQFHFIAALLLCGAAGAALADTDCNDPIAAWKPREVLQQQVEQRGWTVQRIKVDDGCYEVRGVDRKGNRFKARYAPATLRIRSIAFDFGEAGDASDYLQSLPATTQRDGKDRAHKGETP